MSPRYAPLLAFVLASVGLHAAVLGTSWLDAAVPARLPGAAPRPVLVQVGTGAEPTPVRSLDAGLMTVLDATDDGRAPGPLQAEVTPPDVQLALAPLPALQLAETDRQAEPGPDDLYLPRSRLSLPPVLRSQVALVWPAAAEAEGGHFRAVLALFIDELGVVQKVRVEGSGLPAALEAVARESFLGASFVPGELQGLAVKSLIRVEVRFDAERPAGSRGLRL